MNLRSFKHVPSGNSPGLPLNLMFADDFDFDIEIGNLRIWVHARQSPDQTDGGDDDWLFITAHYRSIGASVWISGPIALTDQLHGLLRQLKAMDRELRGKAAFESLEGVLAFSLEMNRLGQIAFHVYITPDHLTDGASSMNQLINRTCRQRSTDCRRLSTNIHYAVDPIRRISGDRSEGFRFETKRRKRKHRVAPGADGAEIPA